MVFENREKEERWRKAERKTYRKRDKRCVSRTEVNSKNYEGVDAQCREGPLRKQRKKTERHHLKREKIEKENMIRKREREIRWSCQQLKSRR